MLKPIPVLKTVLLFSTLFRITSSCLLRQLPAKRKVRLCLLLFCGFTNWVSAQTVNVGTGETYTNLTEAFAAINSGTLSGTVYLRITSNITQTATAVLNASGTGGATYSSVTIYPTSAAIITANLDAPVIELNGADRFTMNGRINGTSPGAEYSLTLENIHTGSNASLLHIYNGGNNNALEHMQLRGSGGSSTRGMFTVDGAGSSINNIIQYSRITNAGGNRPYSVFYVNTTGTSAAGIFVGNEVYNIFRPGGDTKAVVITGTHATAYILNNHFFETAPVTITGSYTYRAIAVESTTATGTLIQGNRIGGSGLNAGGAPMTFTSDFAPQFDAIYIAGGSAIEPTSVQDNTITNISFQSARNNINNIYSPGFFNALYITGTNTHATIGNITGNTIGSQSAVGAIQLFPTNATQYCPAVMIFNDATGIVTIQSTTIGGIRSDGPALAKTVIGILNVALEGTCQIINNTIGSPATAHSIEVGANSLNTSVNELVWGIACLNSTGTVLVTGNQVANITQQATGPHASSLKQLAGIFLSNSGTATVTNNTIYQLNTYSNMLFGGEYSSVAGIIVFQNAGTISEMSSNTIYNLHNLHSGNLTTEVTGIIFKANSGTEQVRNNFIHTLQLASSNTNAKITGVYLDASNGVGLLSNNVIALGMGTSNGYPIYGIRDGSTLATNANKFYYNTLYLTGNAGAGANTTALHLDNATPAGREILNNIFVNERSNTAGSAQHFGLYVTGTPALTANFNSYYTPGTGGLPGFFVSNKNTLPVVDGQDAASRIQNPFFIAPGGTLANHYIPTYPLPGTFLAGYENDFLGVIRPAAPYMGAFHYSSVLPLVWIDFTAQTVNQKVILNWITTQEYNTRNFSIEHSRNGIQWQAIGEIPATGNTNRTNQYQFVHTTLQSGAHYYRVRQRDTDDRFSYSATRRIDMTMAQNLQVLGNPLQAGNLSFLLGRASELSLLTVDGRILWRKLLAPGHHQENMQHLPAGIYFLKTTDETIILVK